MSSDLHEDCEVRFCTYAEDEGKKAYVRGITMMMLKAFYKEVPKDQFEKITVENSLDTGFYCTLRGGRGDRGTLRAGGSPDAEIRRGRHGN